MLHTCLQERASELAATAADLQDQLTRLASQQEGLQEDLDAANAAADEGSAAAEVAAHVAADADAIRAQQDVLVRRLREVQAAKERAELERDRALRAAKSERLRPALQAL